MCIYFVVVIFVSFCLLVTSGNSPSLPFDKAMIILSSFDLIPDQRPNALTFDSHHGVCRLNVESKDHSTWEGRRVGISQWKHQWMPEELSIIEPSLLLLQNKTKRNDITPSGAAAKRLHFTFPGNFSFDGLWLPRDHSGGQGCSKSNFMKRVQA